MSKKDEYLERIKEKDGELKAFLFTPNSIEESEIKGSLTGLVLAIKDNIMVKDWSVTAGSKILKDHMAAYDATVITKLKQAGAVFVGKTNMDEFAMGSSTENSAYQTSKNPWDTSRVPGGSSGGSAVAVAADFCEASLGSDTGGSIRQPASFTGITGLKPTYGAVSRYGLIALASSLDVIGPMAHDADTVEKVFRVIAGQDRFDQTTVPYQYESIEVDLKGLKVGLPKEHWQMKIDGEVRAANQQVIDWLRGKGAEIIDVSLPSLEHALAVYYILMPAEASANLARFDGVRYQSSATDAKSLLDRYLETRSKFGPEAKRRILLGTFVLSVGHFDQYYQTALRVKSKIKQEYFKAFEQVDLLLGPTTPTPAFVAGEMKDPLQMYQQDILTVSTNLAGLPALSMPCGFSSNNLPIGAQLVGPALKENVLLSIAKQYQDETDWHTRKPQLSIAPRHPAASRRGLIEGRSVRLRLSSPPQADGVFSPLE